MDWTAVGYQLGLLTIANRQSPMTRFVMHGSTVKYVLVLDFFGLISPHTPTSHPHARTNPLSAKLESLIGTQWGFPPPLLPFFSSSALPRPSLRASVLNISLNSSRVFLAADGRQFEWRRCPDDPHSYDASLFFFPPPVTPVLVLIGAPFVPCTALHRER